MYALSAVATATPVDVQHRNVQLAIAALAKQPCWSQELHNCVDTTQPSTLVDCDVIRAAYVSPTAADKSALDAAVEAVPFCPAPVTAPTPWLLWIGIGAAGFALGVVLGRALK